jgi:hypothetical protein
VGGAGEIAQADLMATDVSHELRIQRKDLEGPGVGLKGMHLLEMVGEIQAVVPDVRPKVQRGRLTEGIWPDGLDPGEESLELLTFIDALGVDLGRNIVESEDRHLSLILEMELGHLRQLALREVERELPPYGGTRIGFRKQRLSGAHVQG